MTSTGHGTMSHHASVMLMNSEQEMRTQATVHLHNGEELRADRVELTPGWAHIRNAETTSSWEVKDVPAQRISHIESMEDHHG